MHTPRRCRRRHATQPWIGRGWWRDVHTACTATVFETTATALLRSPHPSGPGWRPVVEANPFVGIGSWNHTETAPRLTTPPSSVSHRTRHSSQLPVCVCAGLRKQTPRLVHTPPPLSTGTGLGFSITPTHVTVVYLLLVAHNGVILDGRHVDACTSLLCTHPSSPIKPDTSAA